ncbi:unnamed protein product [Sordaria macrospora k-hell]|uniref:WGS project CABT00000000 data, contig 2.3 n=2 Tax=Sordaria macrospora TaxID=5147 RepID=F7VPH3_SORMK|nr:uncharacterized protein SMAC_02407 [Sordaria macrospora k-hell]KAH7626971.1 hypothetical protein B0T09DRAFT_323972 [Sordaria sp. MPI-SDFR-AT-0083]CCC07401.1 unnamed protein product [Sordaria macrospora k-hell]
MASHEEIWDDSALVNSWNEALAEYKKYHSIHAEGAALPEGVAGEVRDQNPKHSAIVNEGEEVEEGEAMGEDGAAPAAVEVKVENSLESQQPAVAAPPLAGPTAAAVGLPGPGPQLMLGSVQDEELKKLLMSWYYAGYYTGLYEGKQKALQEHAQE